MVTRRLANSMPAIIRTLKTARDTYTNTPNAAERAITPEQFALLDEADLGSFFNVLLKEASDVDIAQAAQAPLTTDLSKAGAQITMFCSHFHQVFDLGVARGDFQAGARSYYGRTVTATSLPDLSTYDAVEAAAEAIVNGEAARQKAEGAAFKPMALPAAAEVGALLAPFQALRKASQAAQVHTDQQREELQALYAKAQALAVDICDTVEFFYRKDPDDGSRRAKCARWGLAYIYGPNASPTPPPVPPPAPAP